MRATAAAVGPEAIRGALRRGAGRSVRATAAAAMGPGRGRPQRVPDKSIKYKEKTEMRESTGNPDQTGNLPIKVEFSAKTENDPTVNTSILVVGFRRNQC